MRAFRSVCRRQIRPVRVAPQSERLVSGAVNLEAAIGKTEETRMRP